MSSSEALWGFFSGSKGLIVPGTAAVPGSKPCARLSLYSPAAPPHCPRPRAGAEPGGDTDTPLGAGAGGSSPSQSFLRGIRSIQNAHRGLFCSLQLSEGRGRKSRSLPCRISERRERGAGLLLSMMQLRVPSPAPGSCQWMKLLPNAQHLWHAPDEGFVALQAMGRFEICCNA